MAACFGSAVYLSAAREDFYVRPTLGSGEFRSVHNIHRHPSVNERIRWDLGDSVRGRLQTGQTSQTAGDNFTVSKLSTAESVFVPEVFIGCPAEPRAPQEQSVKAKLKLYKTEMPEFRQATTPCPIPPGRSYVN